MDGWRDLTGDGRAVEGAGVASADQDVGFRECSFAGLVVLWATAETLEGGRKTCADISPEGMCRCLRAFEGSAAPLAVREMCVKSAVRHHYRPIRVAKGKLTAPIGDSAEQL